MTLVMSLLVRCLNPTAICRNECFNDFLKGLLDPARIHCCTYGEEKSIGVIYFFALWRSTRLQMAFDNGSRLLESGHLAAHWKLGTLGLGRVSHWSVTSPRNERHSKPVGAGRLIQRTGIWEYGNSRYLVQSCAHVEIGLRGLTTYA